MERLQLNNLADFEKFKAEQTSSLLQNSSIEAPTDYPAIVVYVTEQDERYADGRFYLHMEYVYITDFVCSMTGTIDTGLTLRDVIAAVKP